MMSTSEESAMDEPELFRQGGFRLAQRLFVGGDIRGDERQVARLREFAQVEDQRADDVVAWMARQPKGQGRKLFEDALENGVTAPGPLKAFFDEVNAKPHWVDDERLERGAKAITRAGLLGLFPLGDMSLMGGYLASRATKALVGTGEIECQAARRLVETATWWVDVTAAVGEGCGFVWKVLSHVSVAVHSSISRLALGKANANNHRQPNDPVAQ